MTRTNIAACLTAIALTSAACASNHAATRVSSAEFLKAGATPHNDQEKVASNLGQSAIVWGDKHTALRLFTRAEKQKSTPTNRFNLATVYQQLGRTGDAAEMYATVVKDGKGISSLSLNPADDRTTRTRRFDLAEEAQARLDTIFQAASTAPTASTGETEVAVISDEAAAALDFAENPL